MSEATCVNGVAKITLYGERGAGMACGSAFNADWNGCSFFGQGTDTLLVCGARAARAADVLPCTAVPDDAWNFAKMHWGNGASDDAIRAWLHRRRLDQHAGGFNFRKITAGQKLSLHAYGIALHWDAEHNPRKKPLTRTLPDWRYDIWKAHGWSDGRHFLTPDPMHVQFATGA